MVSRIENSGEDVDYLSSGSSDRVCVTRGIEVHEVTVNALAKELGASLDYLFKGLDEYENVDSWIDFSKKREVSPGCRSFIQCRDYVRPPLTRSVTSWRPIGTLRRSLTPTVKNPTRPQ